MECNSVMLELGVGSPARLLCRSIAASHGTLTCLFSPRAFCIVRSPSVASPFPLFCLMSRFGTWECCTCVCRKACVKSYHVLVAHSHNFFWRRPCAGQLMKCARLPYGMACQAVLVCWLFVLWVVLCVFC